MPTYGTEPTYLPTDHSSTEFIVDASKEREMDLSQSQTPLLVGRSAAALLMEDDLMARTGSIQWVEDLIEEFDLYDENGSRPTEKYAGRIAQGENHRWAPDLQQ